MPRVAWRMRWTFSTRAKRTWASPFGAEADPRGHRDERPLEHELGELQRSGPRVALRDPAPDEHRGLRGIDLPSAQSQPLDERVPPLAVRFRSLAGEFLAFAQRDDRGDLDGLEHAVVQVALDARQRVDHLRVSQAEADPPARHAVALRHREDLDADLLGPGNLQQRRRPVSVERDVGVGEVVHEHRAVPVGHLDQVREEVLADARRRGIVRKRCQDHRRLGAGPTEDVLDAAEELLRRRHRHGDLPPVGHHHAPLMDGIGRVRHGDSVSRADGCERQVRQGVLGAHRGDRLGLVVQFDPVVGQISLADLLPQPGDPGGQRVAVVALVPGRFRRACPRPPAAWPRPDCPSPGRRRRGRPSGPSSASC